MIYGGSVDLIRQLHLETYTHIQTLMRLIAIP